MYSRQLLLIGLLGFGLSFSLSAHARLTFCNKTDKPVSVAVAFVQPPGPVSIAYTGGWWSVMPGKCDAYWDGFDGTLENSGTIFYFYAHSESRVWQGDKQLCVKTTGGFDTTRLLNIQTQCGAADYELRGFKPIGIKTKDGTLDLDTIY